MSEQGYPNLRIIDDSIRHLYSALTPARIKCFSDDLLLDTTPRNFRAEPTIATQELARLIAIHFRLAVSVVVVSFRSDLPVPGRVEISNSDRFFIEIDSRYKSQGDCIAAILAHEIAHIFLHQHRIKREPEFENEVLTDTTAAFLGGGLLIMNGATESMQQQAEQTTWQTHHFGYLTLDEFGYVLAKRDYLRGKDASRHLNGVRSLEGYLNGRSKMMAQFDVRPFIPRSIADRLRHFILKRNHNVQQPEATVFTCPYCSQKLRIPSSRKKLLVHCHNCDSPRLTCFS